MVRHANMFFAILIILLVSGCTASQGGTGGIAIKSFTPDIQQVFPGEKIRLQALIENTGSARARITEMKVLGLDGWNPQAVTSECTRGLELLPVRSGISGDTKVCIWEFTAPVVPDRINVDFRPTLRVYYSYSTDLVKNVNILPRQELVQLQSQGKPLPIDSVSGSVSPVTFSLEAQGPIRLAGSDVTFPVKITATNTGGGSVCLDDCTLGNQNIDAVSIRLESGMTLQDCQSPIRLSLFKGSNSIQCKLTASGLDPGQVSQKQIELHSDYIYFADRETVITLTGKP
ncbi:MAG: hypothetical protein HY518_02435 [Candidatus Aenigmarchaeota archaeon]|nr:hypothetical protein [Candidatus Aenigmarchaeota archaeon]